MGGLELYSFEELKDRNCLGRVYSETLEKKKRLEERKLNFIKASVLSLHPARSDACNTEVGNKCMRKINNELRYLFKTSLKKHDWR